MDIQGTDVAALPNGHIMVSCCDSGAINLYDHDFNLIKKVTAINNQAFKCHSSTTNNKDRIFIADTINNRLLATDLNFQYLSSFTIQQPFGICFKDYVFTCSYDESKIYKHDTNLQLMNAFSFANNPWQIKVNDDKAVVSFANFIRIYDLQTFSRLLVSIDIKYYSGNICLCNEFVITTQSQDVMIFNMQGEVIQRISSVIKDGSADCYHGLEIVSHKLIITRRNNTLKIYD